MDGEETHWLTGGHTFIHARMQSVYLQYTAVATWSHLRAVFGCWKLSWKPLASPSLFPLSCLAGLLHGGRRGSETWLWAAAARHGDGRLLTDHPQAVRPKWLNSFCCQRLKLCTGFKTPTAAIVKFPVAVLAPSGLRVLRFHFGFHPCLNRKSGTILTPNVI